MAVENELVVFDSEREILCGKVSAEERPDAEFVPPRVQSWVSQHRYARKLQFIQRRDRRIIPPSAAHERNATLVHEVVELVLKIILREDGIRGADKRAATATNAVTLNVSNLAHNMSQPARGSRVGVRARRGDYALSIDRGFDGFHGANGRAAAAACAAVFPPLNNIGKFFYRELVVLI